MSFTFHGTWQKKKGSTTASFLLVRPLHYDYMQFPFETTLERLWTQEGDMVKLLEHCAMIIVFTIGKAI